MKKHVIIFPEMENINLYLKDIWLEQLYQSIDKQGYFTSVLSGGNTPLAFYRELSRIDNIPWKDVYFFLADDRFVNWESKDSNYGNIKKVLFDKINIPEKNIYKYYTSKLDLKGCAEEYQKAVIKFFNERKIKFPEFDFILLGLGIDGHVASLFPGDKALNDNKNIALAIDKEYFKYKRISLSLPVLNNGKEVYFIITSESKIDIVHQVLNLKNNNCPAVLIKPKSGEINFLLDRGAAYMINYNNCP